jgi:iron only hydrogenase large subunit-like protein
MLITFSCNTSKECVYHVSVMPCYDKKLEATRPDFYDPVNSSRDVDCVLTTGFYFSFNFLLS